VFWRPEDAEKAREQDREYGDLLKLKQARTTFGRIAAQTAKQVLLQRMRDAETSLPARLRLVLKLRIHEGWTLREVADHLGVTSRWTIWGSVALVFAIRVLAVALDLNAPKPLRTGRE